MPPLIGASRFLSAQLLYFFLATVEKFKFSASYKLLLTCKAGKERVCHVDAFTKIFVFDSHINKNLMHIYALSNSITPHTFQN
jgi:hypothetical protein